MRTSFAAALCSALIGLLVASSPALAQQKTVKACEDEWRANRQCRAGGAVTTPAAGPAATPKAAPKAPTAAAPAGQKTVRVCQNEWRGNRAAYQAAGITEKAYVDKCRAGETVALPSIAPTRPAPAPTVTAPAPAPTTTTTPAPARVPPATAPARAPAPAATTAPTGANQFQTEAQAKFRCPSDVVVWANLDSKIYHFSGYKSYGTTKQGAYMCERDATAQGIRASRTEKRP
jgi:hypothetical protein